MNKTVLIGATGLIGSHILKQLLEDDQVSEIRVLVRRPFEATCSRIKVVTLDFANLKAYSEALQGCDTVFCSIGTTRSQTPDLNNYRKVDFDIPVNAARLSAGAGVNSFHLVSAVGANSNSSNFYLRMKGEVEETVSTMAIPGIVIYRPSLLLGKRNKPRVAEVVSGWIMKLFKPLFPDKYKPIQASDVAGAMIRDAKSNIKGTHVFHYSEMKTT